MIIGKIKPGEKKVKFSLEIRCTDCGNKVPGGLQASESHYGTDAFNKEIEEFKKRYLCGRCRDKKRLENNY